MSKTRRTVKNSKKVAVVSRSEALTAAKNVKSRRVHGAAKSESHAYESAPPLVKK
jgi:hypothetical protein